MSDTLDLLFEVKDPVDLTFSLNIQIPDPSFYVFMSELPSAPDLVVVEPDSTIQPTGALAVGLFLAAA